MKTVLREKFETTVYIRKEKSAMEKKKVMDQGKGNGEWGRYREESCTFK